MMEKLPSGKILNAADLGKLVRAKRKETKLTQAEFAALCGVGNRFLSDLENGKPTIQFEKVLQILERIGMEMVIQPRYWINIGREE